MQQSEMMNICRQVLTTARLPVVLSFGFAVNAQRVSSQHLVYNLDEKSPATGVKNKSKIPNEAVNVVSIAESRRKSTSQYQIETAQFTPHR